MNRVDFPEGDLQRKGVLRNFAKFKGKQTLFNKVASLSLQLYQEGDSGTGVFL